MEPDCPRAAPRQSSSVPAAMLMRRDPRLGALIKRVGRCCLPDSRGHDPFAGLVRVIMSQQLSGKAADTIFGRVVALAGGLDAMTPDALRAVEATALRGAGVSRPKVQIPARSRRPRARRPARSPRARRPPGRRSDRDHHVRQRTGPLVRGDVPDVPPEPARHLSGRRPRHRQRHAEALRHAPAAVTTDDGAARRAVAAVSVGGRVVPMANPRIGPRPQAQGPSKASASRSTSTLRVFSWA